MKVVELIKTVFVIIGLSLVGIFCGVFFVKKIKSTENETSENIAINAQKEKYDEIENTRADQLVIDAGNAAELVAIRGGIKEDFRERIRNRLRENIQRLGSNGVDSDNN